MYRIETAGGFTQVGGDIVGAFGVAYAATDNGFFRVTHLFTGLAIAPLASKHRGRCLVAARVLNDLVKDWQGRDKFELAALNDMTLTGLRDRVYSAAKIGGCEGENV
mgnify:CR=1 FL=1